MDSPIKSANDEVRVQCKLNCKHALVDLINKNNPWLNEQSLLASSLANFQARIQDDLLLSPEFDDMCLLLMEPQQAGKTTLGKYLASQLFMSFRELLKALKAWRELLQ